MQTDTARQADGRTTRWERHNATRRTRLVQDAVRAIRAHGPTSKVAVIMLTGRADRELVQRAVQFGVNNYLVKPFTTQTLKEKIEAVFGPLS